MNKDEVLAWLEKNGTQKGVDDLARYGIVSRLRVFGVPMGMLLKLKKQIGKDHALSAELWSSGCYEGRLLAALVGDPEQVTRKQMNAWAGEFENWADCDTVVFHLFDRTPFAWAKVHEWAKSPREFVKRAAFWMLATLTVHDKAADDEQFVECLPLIEKAAADDRHFVKKAVACALRSIGKHSPPLRAPATELAQRLADSLEPSCRWVGKEVVRELSKSKSRPGRKK